MIGDFSGSAFRVPGAAEVVVDQQTVHGEAGVFGHVACGSENSPRVSVGGSGPRTGTEEEFYPTVGAKDVGEDGPQVLVVRQLVNHLRQAARRHFEEKGQTLGEASGRQQLGQGGGADLQDSEEPNTPAGFLKMGNT